MSEWDTVTVLRKRTAKAGALKTESAINSARRQGVPIETQQKCKPKNRMSMIEVSTDIECRRIITDGAGTNRQHVTTKNTAKLDRETEELRHEKIPLEVGKLIMQGRQSKGLSQKELATVSGTP